MPIRMVQKRERERKKERNRNGTADHLEAESTVFRRLRSILSWRSWEVIGRLRSISFARKGRGKWEEEVEERIVRERARPELFVESFPLPHPHNEKRHLVVSAEL